LPLVVSCGSDLTDMLQQVFAERRRKFAANLPSGSIAIFPSAPIRPRNNDVDYEYRQDSNFFYLTGFEEPESLCVISRLQNEAEYFLFVRPRDKEKETWTGFRAGVEGALKQYGADKAFTNDQLDSVLPLFLQGATFLYYTLSSNHEMDLRLLKMLDSLKQLHRSGISAPSQLIDPAEILSEMRLIKAPEDIQTLQQAVNISGAAHIAAMNTTAPGKFEYQIQAVLEYVFRSSGSPRNGYPCIVGSGPNTCILHYNQNNRKMKDGDLLLVDAGAELDYFTGDITRTYPVSGRFTPQQRDVYQIVLAAQQKAINAAVIGNDFMSVHNTAVASLTEGIIALGLLSGNVDENIEKEHYKKYFLHRTGHWLGMDVHDVGRYKVKDRWRPLAAGMVFTVEPGIYIPAEDEHAHFRNIGIRIEDDVLITPDGPQVLSSRCPKQIPELEDLVGAMKEGPF
jgi:Xaa-Pro aminopeptidase